MTRNSSCAPVSSSGQCVISPANPGGANIRFVGQSPKANHRGGMWAISGNLIGDDSSRVIPVLHGVTFDELNDVSPMLASHAGLSTQESTLDNIAAKIAAAAAALPAA